MNERTDDKNAQKRNEDIGEKPGITSLGSSSPPRPDWLWGLRSLLSNSYRGQNGRGWNWPLISIQRRGYLQVALHLQFPISR